ncbi:MAG: (2Fe-2S)-binding protein [Chloroflexota bacterium]
MDRLRPSTPSGLWSWPCERRLNLRYAITSRHTRGAVFGFTWTPQRRRLGMESEIVDWEAVAVIELKCPECGSVGQPVPRETVESLAVVPIPESATFSACLNPDCDLVYFSQICTVRSSETSVPIAWKKGATPKYICYCGRVTEEDIVRAVRERGARSIADVARLTGAMKGCDCLTKNPKGMCCHGDIADLLARESGGQL